MSKIIITAALAVGLALGAPLAASATSSPVPSPSPTASTQTYTGPIVTNQQPLTGKPPVEQLPQTLPFTGANDPIEWALAGLCLILLGVVTFLLVQLRRWSRS